MSVEMEPAQAANSVCSPPQPNPGLPGFGHLKICRKRASPQPPGGGAGGGGRSKDTVTCPQGTSHESGRSAIVRSCHRSVASPGRCAPLRRKPSGSSGGTCATEFLRQALISVARLESAATSPILPVTRHALSSRSMEASTVDQQLMRNARRFSKRTAIAYCDIGIATYCRISIACSRTYSAQ